MRPTTNTGSRDAWHGRRLGLATLLVTLGVVSTTAGCATRTPGWLAPTATSSVASPGASSRSAPSVPRVAVQQRVIVARVVDGDSLQLGDGQRVRLLGVDACETSTPQGPVATGHRSLPGRRRGGARCGTRRGPGQIRASTALRVGAGTRRPGHVPGRLPAHRGLSGTQRRFAGVPGEAGSSRRRPGLRLTKRTHPGISSRRQRTAVPLIGQPHRRPRQAGRSTWHSGPTARPGRTRAARRSPLPRVARSAQIPGPLLRLSLL